MFSPIVFWATLPKAKKWRLEDAINRSERAKLVKMIEGQVNEEASE
jgi:hypothetical protein